MISLKNAPSMFLTVLAILGPTIRAAEPNESAPPLTFEISSAPLDVGSSLRTMPEYQQASFRHWQPRYAVAIPLSDRMNFLALIEARGEHGFLDFLQQRAYLSEQQRKFLDAVEWIFPARRPSRRSGEAPRTIWHSTLIFGEPRDPNRPQVVLYALTLEDAKKMAEVYVEFARDVWCHEVDEYEVFCTRSEQAIASSEQRMMELDKLFTTTRKSLDEFEKTVPYRTTDAALEAIGDLTTMVNAALVDIAGIRVKIAAIQKYQEPVGGAMLEQLKLMFIEESIALEAAEARRQTATQLREQAQTFVDLHGTLQKTSAEKDQAAAHLDEKRKDLTHWQDLLEQTQENKPEIRANTATIYPIKWAPEDQGD